MTPRSLYPNYSGLGLAFKRLQMNIHIMSCSSDTQYKIKHFPISCRRTNAWTCCCAMFHTRNVYIFRIIKAAINQSWVTLLLLPGTGTENLWRRASFNNWSISRKASWIPCSFKFVRLFTYGPAMYQMMDHRNTLCKSVFLRPLRRFLICICWGAYGEQLCTCISVVDQKSSERWC